MHLSLAGLWQISPLTDLSVPQNDITFPAALSSVLPDTLGEKAIQAQEWHLMHDIDVDESMMAFPAVELVMSGVDYFAEVRLNGVAIFDCDGTQATYRKDIFPYMQLGRNRFEILFLEEEEEWLFEDDQLDNGEINTHAPEKSDDRIGIWQAPYLQFIRNIKLEQITTEQIWHHGGGCEFKVDVDYKTLKPGLVSASVKFNGMTYVLPIDARANHTCALFQVEAPKYANLLQPDDKDLYSLDIELDGQAEHALIALNPDASIRNTLR